MRFGFVWVVRERLGEMLFRGGGFQCICLASRKEDYVFCDSSFLITIIFIKDLFVCVL